jgi:TctA family transporter
MELIKSVIGTLLLLTVVIGIWYGVVAGLWYGVLWAFGFPIAFAWKQVIGLVLLSIIFSGPSAAK